MMWRLIAGAGALLFAASIVLAASSAGGEFSVTPDSQPVNWSNSTGMGAFTANLTLNNTNTTRNITLLVYNETSAVVNGAGTRAPFTVTPDNSTLITNGSSVNVTLVFSTGGLVPGRYSGNVSVSNSTNATENTTVEIILDVPLNVNASGYGSISGNVTNSTFDVFYVNMTAVSAYGLRVNLTEASALPVNLSIYDGSGTLKGSASFNASNSTQLDYTSAQTGYWLLNWTANSTVSFNASVELLEASLLGGGVPGAVTVTNRTNRGYNSTIRTYFWLNNSADWDVNITSITNSSWLNLTTDSTKRMQITGYNITAPWNLSANNGTLVAVNIGVNTLNTSDSAGNYVGWIAFATDRGYPNSTLNVTLTVNLTGALDLQDLSFVNESGGTNILPGSRLNITVQPKWQNGTTVPNLIASNFAAWMQHQNYTSLTSGARNLSLTVNNVTWNTTHYTINATVPSGALGGNHTLYIQVAENSSNSGVGAVAGVLTVNETALKLSIEDANLADISSSTSVSLSGGSTWKARGRVWNYGQRSAYAVNVSRSASGSCISFTSGAGATVGIGDLGPGANNHTTGSDLSGQIWTFTAANSSGSCTLTISANASGTAWDRQSITLTFSVSVDDGSGDTPGGDQAGGSTNSSPTTTEMTILDWPKDVQVAQGSSQTVSVRVKNSGGTQLDDVIVSVEGVSSGWWSSTDKRSLAPGTFSDWSVRFNVPASAAVANYSITFVASNPKTTARATGTLVVTPGPATQEEIKRNITNMSADIADLQGQIDKLKAAGKNVTQANATLAEAASLLQQANASANAGSWLAAFNALAAARAKVAEARDQLSSASQATAAAVLPGVFSGELGVMIGAFLAGIGLAGAAVWLALKERILRVRKGVLLGHASAPARAAHKKSPIKRLLEQLRRRKPTAYHWRPRR